MNKPGRSLAVLCWLFALFSTHLFAAARQNKPNIIFIMADDLGWFDVGYNGAPFYERRK